MANKLYVEVCYVENDYEIDLEVFGTFIPGSPGRLSGPPEFCYPAEPDDFEVETVTHEGSDILPLMSDEVVETVIELAIEAIRSLHDGKGC